MYQYEELKWVDRLSRRNAQSVDPVRSIRATLETRSAVQVLRSEWLSAQYEVALAENNMGFPHGVVDAEMRSLGFPADHVSASRIDSECVKCS